MYIKFLLGSVKPLQNTQDSKKFDSYKFIKLNQACKLD